MTQACRQAGLADPTIEELAGRVRVPLSAVRSGAPDLDDLDDLDGIILDELEGPDGLTTAALSRAIGRTPGATRTRLLDLVERRLVVEIGSSPNDPKRRYLLADAGDT